MHAGADRWYGPNHPLRRGAAVALALILSLWLAAPAFAQSVTTLAGSAGSSGTTDGTGTAARFNNPDGIAVDSSGNLYVADRSNHTIRRVTAAGVVTTLAGSAGSTGTTDGIGTAARFNTPIGVSLDSSGTTVYVGDFGNHTIRKIVLNTAPAATAQTVSDASEDTAKTITLAGTDADSDNLTFAIASNPDNGSLGSVSQATNVGTDDSATVTYTPTANYNGSDSFTFTVNDGTETSSAATVTITVNAVNDAPTATAQSTGVLEDTPATITLTGSDVDAQELTFAVASNPSNGSLGTVVQTTLVGTTDSATVTYTPSGGYSGTDSFTFTVTDGTATSSAATVSITVRATNDAPQLVTNQGLTLTRGATALIGRVALEVVDADHPSPQLRYSITSGPAHGSLSRTQFGQNDINDGRVSHTHDGSATTSDSFGFTVTDGAGATVSGTFTITITQAVIGTTTSTTAVESTANTVQFQQPGAAPVEVGIGTLSTTGELTILGVIRDGHLPTYALARRASDGQVVRVWIPPNSALSAQIAWPDVISTFTFPVDVVASVPLDETYPQPNQLVRRFDGADERILAYDASLQQWRQVPDIATFQALGFYWCDVGSADSGMFDRITIGDPHPTSSQLARTDYPACR